MDIAIHNRSSTSSSSSSSSSSIQSAAERHETERKLNGLSEINVEKIQETSEWVKEIVKSQTQNDGRQESRSRSSPAQGKKRIALPPPKIHRSNHHKSPHPIFLSPHSEFQALQTYLRSDASHSLPSNMDPKEPLDPYALLGFKLGGKSGIVELEEEVRVEEREVGNGERVVVWTNDEIWTEPILNLLSLYALHPPPAILPISTRSDRPILLALLNRLLPILLPSSPSSSPSPPPSSSNPSLPLIVIGGTPIGGYEQLSKLHSDGDLHSVLEKAGATVDEGRRVKEEERRREERMKVLRVNQAVVRRK